MATSDPDTGTRSPIFKNMKFWVSALVPRRVTLKEQIQNHGGTVALFEKRADSSVINIVDHLKKNLPADSYDIHQPLKRNIELRNFRSVSYQFVERSVENGRLEDIEPYRIGPSDNRPVGAAHIPKKSTKTDYTLEDDQVLFDHMLPLELDGNAPICGNKIYKSIEDKFPQHTWQSWRARYLKFLRGRPRPGGPKMPSLVSTGEPQLPLHPIADPPKTSTSAPPCILAAEPSQYLTPALLHSSAERQSDSSKSSRSQTNSGNAKRKWDSTSETSSRQHREKRDKRVSPTKRGLIDTSDAIDSLAMILSHSKRRSKQPASPRQSPSRSPDPATSSDTSRPQNNPLEATPPPPTSDGNQATQSSIKDKNTFHPRFWEILFPPGPTPEQNQAVQTQNESEAVFMEMPNPPTSSILANNKTTRSENESGTTTSLYPETPVIPLSPTTKHNQTAQPQNEAKMVASLFFEMPFPPSSPEPEPQQDEDEDEYDSYPDIDSWIDARLARGDVELPIVLEALQCTSMNPEYAEKVIAQYAAGKGIPYDMPGVWTAEDDKCLEGSNQRDIKALFDKHGEELCEARFEFLALMRG
ncbi:hypothetical protein N7466_007865 [Penicillium verhagenii]|uniref:uncharacterized protein n=1 Tax=Penicillium verhagenii TaxID=1562060 RepID=UPI002545B2E6|nr:uncharacterized protein N7466_007865 [Penicillium verhagenii]KAJ5928909.1 hypothetical protein N7466_007865 [Penicillium verhagenii]